MDASAHWKPWQLWLIRATLVAAGLVLLFFPPSFLAGRLFPKIGGCLALLSGVLGPDRMGHLNTVVLLSGVYFLGVGPMKLINAIRRDHPLEAPEGPSFWRRKPAPDPSMDPRRRIRFQF